jgi:Arc/MetJ family transcription regulator
MCMEVTVRTNIELDDRLVEEAMQVSGAKTKKDLVNLALRELIKAKRKRSILDLAGQIDFAEDYDPKAGWDRDL